MASSVASSLDEVILSPASHNWSKVAMIIAKALRELESKRVPISDDVIAARVRALVKAGRLEAHGDLSKWRHNEVRLRTDAAAGRKYLPADLPAELQNEMGSFEESIDLMRQAVREKPGWLPHAYRLSVFLMDAKQWFEANAALDQLISLSEDQHDVYFLDEARFRKIICLKELGRDGEVPEQKAKIDPDGSFFIDNRCYRVRDLD
jgi:tetratricopeptide (TPR) repeat protein